ncbi:MAE_28990/MAE_18760 family HEPN-like nuclease [Streptomyces sp. NPDC001815]|uniref:MAE_28990/MAE_18760 family HEPN-like nuclease n=1 Tax=Streptomyces sp. NPDC001815 TaxID=3154526 RepID=UPI00332D1B13
MNAADLLSFFEERFEEVDAYVDLLEELEKAAQDGAPRLDATGYKISATQQRILYSSLYLQLYNLVEATVSRCVDAITQAAAHAGKWKPQQLNEELHREWVRSIARTHTDMSPEHRLRYAMQLSEHIVQQLPVAHFSVEAGGGGNWDDEAIFAMGKRLGCVISITDQTRRVVKTNMRDDLGPLKLVKDRRNGLAHGSISFVDCADGVAVEELRRMAASVESYLREVIHCFIRYIESHNFLRPDCRPNGGAP